MSHMAWIDTTREETWQPGLRAAVLLLRAGETVSLHPGADANAPYLAVDRLSGPVTEWLERQGVTLVDHQRCPPSEDLVRLQPPAVAVFGGAGSPYNHASAVAALGLPWFYVTGRDIAAGALRHADVFVVPGGGWRHGNGQLADLGVAGTDEVIRFIEAGGGYLASCAGSLIAMRLPDDALGAHHPTKAAFTLLDVENWEPLRTAVGGHRSPGIGRVQTQFTSPRHPVALGLSEHLEMTHYNGPIFAEPDSALTVVARYAGVTNGFTPSECFFGHADQPSDADRSGSVMAEAGRQGQPAIVVGERGRGRVVLAGLHPEFGLGPALDDWGRPVQVIANVILWQAKFGRGMDPHYPVTVGATLNDAAIEIRRGLDQASVAVQRLGEIDDPTGPPWPDDATPRAAFGQTPSQLWSGAVDSLAGVLDRIEAGWAQARDVAGAARGSRLAAAALHRYEPADGYDLGAQGAVWLMEEATRLIDEAIQNSLAGGARKTLAEERVSRSYLSAVGVLTNAAQRLETELATYRAEDDLERLRTLLTEDVSVLRVS